MDATAQLESCEDAAANGSTQRGWAVAAVGGLLILLLGGVNLATLHPGVGRGDSAELQYVSPLLGVCHPPGYAIGVTFAKLFSLLPVGEGAAWRINFMTAVCGVLGCLALYAAVWRITRQLLPALVAATILSFSSIFWGQSLLAEVYVFYAMFLLWGVYAAVRFIESDRAGWLYLTALLLGVCVGDRVSEAFILPAFVVLWIACRRRVRLSVARLAVALALFVLPFAYSVSFFLVRFDSAQPCARDDAERARVIERRPPFAELSAPQRLRYAVHHCLGLSWARHLQYSPERLRWDIDKYAWLLSGGGGFGDRFEPGDPLRESQQRQQGQGSSVGVLGLFLAALGVWFGRRQWRWVVFGLGLFVGNTAFYLLHQPSNNLSFTIPGLIGLAFLAGLGAAGVIRRASRTTPRTICRVACLAAPLFLLVSNYRFVNRRTAEEHQRVAHCARLAEAPLPPEAVIISRRNSGMVYRYLFHLVAGREDVSVVNADEREWPQLIRHFYQQGRPTFLRTTRDNRRHFGRAALPGDAVPMDVWARFCPNTPEPLAKLGFLLAEP